MLTNKRHNPISRSIIASLLVIPLFLLLVAGCSADSELLKTPSDPATVEVPKGKTVPAKVEPLPTAEELQRVDTTPSGAPTTAKPSSEVVVYPGQAKITMKIDKTCVEDGTGFLYLNPDQTFRISIVTTLLNGDCSPTGNGQEKQGWDLTGTYQSGTLTFVGCNDSPSLHSDGTGTYTAKDAAASARCVESDGNAASALEMTFHQ